MQKSALQTLIEQAAHGDEPAIKKLTRKLCDRLVYIPTAGESAGSQSVNVSFIRIREGERKLIPVFLTNQALKRWLELMEISGESMSLYCSDVFKAVGPDHWMLLEAGSPYWAEIEPNHVEEIRLYEPDEDDEFLDQDDWSTRTETSQKVDPKPIPQQQQVAKPTMNREQKATQEVPIVPRSMIEGNASNPPTGPQQFGFSPTGSGVKRFRQEEDDEVRSTMDLTALRQLNKL